nr:MAG TPA: hypothetical protein [Caudoviricetes sp.]
MRKQNIFAKIRNRRRWTSKVWRFLFGLQKFGLVADNSKNGQFSMTIE